MLLCRMKSKFCCRLLVAIHEITLLTISMTKFITLMLSLGKDLAQNAACKCTIITIAKVSSPFVWPANGGTSIRPLLVLQNSCCGLTTLSAAPQPVVKVGGRNTFLEGQDFSFYYMFKIFFLVTTKFGGYRHWIPPLGYGPAWAILSTLHYSWQTIENAGSEVVLLVWMALILNDLSLTAFADKDELSQLFW